MNEFMNTISLYYCHFYFYFIITVHAIYRYRTYYLLYFTRTNDTVSPGQCGLAMNPVAAIGGYVLNRDDLEDQVRAMC